MLTLPNQTESQATKSPAATFAAPQSTFGIRELSKLIADIRRTRAQFEPTEATDRPVPLELVVGADPRD